MEKILLLLFIFSHMVILANSMSLSGVYTPDKSVYDKDNRSISSVPTIELNGNLLWIHTSHPLENCEVQLYNEKGIIIYKDSISIFPTQSYCIVLDNYQHGIYLLQLNHVGMPPISYTLSL